jgi:RHS repeat-associated protein
MSEPVPNNSTMTAYVYDAEGNRVAKGVISSWPANGLCPNLAAAGVFTPTASYILGLSNEQITETDGQGQWKHTNVYAAGTIIATYDAPSGTPALHFQLEDWLGTRRVQTNINGTPEESYFNLPFGDGLTTMTPSGAPATADDATEHHFTGKERDTESGNDYFGARYYASSMGRFMSPDWSAKVEPIPYSKLDNPQSLNLYAYVLNNPLTRVDADGHTWQPERFGCSEGQKDCNTDQQKAQQQIHTETTITVHANTHWWNKVGSFFGKAEHGIAYGMTAFIITHSHWAMENNKSGFEYWSKQSNEDIIKSLNPGGKEPMQVRTEVDSEGEMNFRVLNGNTRLGILQSRGADLGGLNPESLPPVMQLEPLGMPKTGSGAGAETEPEPLEFPE